MARALFGIEKGVRLFSENGAAGVDMLFGSGIPGGDSGDQDAAALGSLYARTDGTLYSKKASANTTADWIRIATLDDVFGLAWRSEKVIALTADAAPSSGSTIDLSSAPFSDDDAPTLAGADFVVGNHILFGYGGTPVLMKVSAVAGNVITVISATDPLADNDTFVVQHFLPDSPDAQEAQAIVTFNGTSLIKLADFNWSLADGINLTGGYVGNGTNATPAAGDTVEAAIGKLDANQRDLTTLSGVAIGAVDNGTFTGFTIPDTQTTKQALQALETAVEAKSQQTGITTAVTLDSVVVDNVLAAEWDLVISEDATPTNVRYEKIRAVHDGTASADAVNVDDTTYGVLKLGSAFNCTVSIDLNGTAGSQVMRLRVASTSAGVTATARRSIVRYA